MVRLRLPGGRVTAETLVRLVELATSYGNGIVQLTSRAGLQVRGLPDPLPSAFVAAVAATGLLPSTTHERVRNIVASPLTGLSGGLTDLRPLIAELDAGLIAEPSLSALPGRFLFVLDDGRGDVVDLTFDLGYQATGRGEGRVLVASPDSGLAVSATEAVPVLLDLARQFVTARTASGAWHVAELPAWIESLDLTSPPATHGSPSVPLGHVGDAASVLVPLARLDLKQARAIDRAVSSGPVVVTPWRGLVLPGASGQLEALANAGMVIDDESAWAGISACVGAPACARARADTAAIAEVLAASGKPVRQIHISGCERRCGAPAHDHLDLVAPQASVSVSTAR